MTKRITIDQLATMVANGFADIMGRIDGLATKKELNEMEVRLEERMTDKFQVEIDRLDSRLDRMAPDFDVKDLKRRVTKIENHLGMQN